MNAINWKKLLLPNIPYLLFVYLFDKVGQAVRLTPGAGRRYALRRGLTCPARYCRLGRAFLWLLQIHFRALPLWIY